MFLVLLLLLHLMHIVFIHVLFFFYLFPFLNQQKNKDKKNGFLREKKTGNQKRERLMKENYVMEYPDVVLFMKQKQRRRTRKERDKNKEAEESKNERQEGRKK